MELIMNNKILKFSFIACLIVIPLIILMHSCKNEGNDISDNNCLDCLQEKPDSAYLTIKVSLNHENNYCVPIVIYNDKFDPTRQDSSVYIEYIDTARTVNYKLLVPVNKFYSVRAKYISGQKTIYAIDGSIFEAQKQSGCDCYQMVGGRMDATLAFK
jgi:hypothetical protein